MDRAAPFGRERAKPRRLLIIAYYYPPLGMGGVKTVIPYVRYLADYGWRPEVLTVRSIAYYAYDDELALELRPYAPVTRCGSLDPARLLRLLKGPDYRVPLAEGALRHGGLLSRLQHALLTPDPKVLSAPFFYEAGRRTGRGGRYDALLVIAPPFSHLAMARRLAHSLHVPWAAHLGDRWVDGWVSDSTSLLARPAAARGERRAVESARALLCASPLEAEALRAKYPAAARKILTASLSFDPALHDLEERPDPGRFTVALVGTHIGERALGGDAGMPAVLNALKRMAGEEHQRRVVLRHVGSNRGPSVGSLADGIGCVELVEEAGQVDYRRSLVEMHRADVLLLTLAGGNPLCLPGRISDYIGSGRPILVVSDNEAAGRVIEDYGLGAVCRPTEEERIYELLRAARDGSGSLAQEPDPAGRDHFAAPRRAEQLAEVLTRWYPNDHV